MSEGWFGSYAKSGFGGSTWRERRQKRREDREYEQEEKQSDLGEESYQTHRTISSTSWRKRFDKRDEELECLRRFIRDLELEARGRRRRRDHEERGEGLASVGGSYRVGSH